MQVQFLKPALFIFGLVLPAWIIFRLLINARRKAKGKTAGLKKEFALSLFVIYIGITLELTIVPASLSGFNNPPDPALNVIPFINTYKQFIFTLAEADHTNRDFALENIIGNIILFLPLGIFLPGISGRFNTLKKVAGICFLCSLSIELIQLILRQFGTRRTVDIDDIILNTIGGALGWLIFSKWIAVHFYRQGDNAGNTSLKQ